jgi:ferrochelatase
LIKNNFVLPKKGVLLVNLGSPDSTEVKDVRKYLDEFLMDERVIDIAYWKRFLLIKGIILNTRPKKSAAAYKKIWWKEGSPLVVISERFTEKLRGQVDLSVSLGMRYGSMSIEKGLRELSEKNVGEVLLVPLYPHYAMSSYETVVEKAKEVLKDSFPEMKMSVLEPFYDRKDYIEVMSENIREQLKGFDYDHLLFSYHGIPERHIYKSDVTGSHCKIDGSCCKIKSEAHKTCYRHQCFETTRAIAEHMQLDEGSYSDSFQSRLLKDPWLRPYTDFELERLAEEGVRKLAVVTPAFVSDCLETLEEIAMEGKEEFIDAGGADFIHVACLNDYEPWVQVMANWVKSWSQETQ